MSKDIFPITTNGHCLHQKSKPTNGSNLDITNSLPLLRRCHYTDTANIGTVLVTNTSNRFIRLESMSQPTCSSAPDDPNRITSQELLNQISSIFPLTSKTKAFDSNPITKSPRFFGVKGHRSISQEAFVMPVNTCFSVKGVKGRSGERKAFDNSPSLSSEEVSSQDYKTRSSSSINNNENSNRPKKRFSYPLIGGYDKEIPGIQRLPLSPVKAKQPRHEVAMKPNILGPGKTKTSKVNQVVSLLDNDSSSFDIYDPNNSLDTFSPTCFTIQRNRILRRLNRSEGNDFFSVLPDEMVLKIFMLLPKTALFNCAVVSHRFHELASDETLWKRIDVMGKFLTSESVKVILARNPMYLRLARSLVTYPFGYPEHLYATQLLYLDLSMAEIAPATLARILSMCTSLVKCSLEALCVTTEVMKAMLSFCPSIDTLNLTMCIHVNVYAFANFLSRSPKLKYLNIGCIQQNWTAEENLMLINILPQTLVRLNLAGFVQGLRDEHVQLLVSRLPHLRELDLSDSQEITYRAVEYIVEGLKGIEALGLSRCYNIPIGTYLILPAAERLTSVQLFAIFKEPTMTDLQKTLPQITFNQQPCSTIARPTVGNRRSSIWGERIRD